MTTKPNERQRRTHLRKGLRERDKCLVCDNPLLLQPTALGKFENGVATGQCRCVVCGATYRKGKTNLTPDFLKSMKLKTEQVAQLYCECFLYVPILRAYHKETGNPVTMGVWLPTKNPYTKDQEVAFAKWLELNLNIWPEYREDFSSEMLKQLAKPAKKGGKK